MPGRKKSDRVKKDMVRFLSTPMNSRLSGLAQEIMEVRRAQGLHIAEGDLERVTQEILKLAGDGIRDAEEIKKRLLV